jgi:hypothetical protein
MHNEPASGKKARNSVRVLRRQTPVLRPEELAIVQQNVAAIHEAGHVVASVELGVPALSVRIPTIEELISTDNDIPGTTMINRSEMSPAELVMVLFAGELAQRRYMRPLGMPADIIADWANDRTEIKLVFDRMPLEPYIVNIVRRRLRRRTATLVRRNWDQIEALAGVLVQHRNDLSREEIEKVLTRVRSSREAAPG